MSIFWAFSRISLFFTNIPFPAHSPWATTIASGVANPREQGHATTNIVTNVIIASLNVCPQYKIYDKCYYTY